MNDELRSLNSVDFLPHRYRDAKVKRSASGWRLGLVIVMAVLLLSTAYFQQRFLSRAKEDLAKVNLLYAQAQALSKTVVDERAKLAPIDCEAELLSYLRHPWPRTQILNAVLASAPPSIRLTNLNLKFELPERPTTEHTLAAKVESVDQAPSAERDLKRLREALDGGRWIVSLNGTTENAANLHTYLADLEQKSLFSKVQLISIESPQSAGSTNALFAVQITILPGFGQPGGPAIKTSAMTPLEKLAEAN